MSCTPENSNRPIILQPYWRPCQVEQVAARGIRASSHMDDEDLPELMPYSQPGEIPRLMTEQEIDIALSWLPIDSPLRARLIKELSDNYIMPSVIPSLCKILKDKHDEIIKN